SEPAHRTRYLTDDEEGRLRTTMTPVDWQKVRVSLLTGLDRGVQFAMRWEQVDLLTRTITTERHKGRRVGAVRVPIPINDELLGILRSLPSRLTSELVFPNAAGTGPTDGRVFDRLVFAPALRRAGIRGLRWKDLRHTYATRLRLSGSD